MEQNVQVIWHRNRRQNSPLVELVEHNTARFPSMGIRKHWFASVDAKRNEVNRGLFPRQPVWNPRRSAHLGNYQITVSQRRPTNQFAMAPTRSQSGDLCSVLPVN